MAENHKPEGAGQRAHSRDKTSSRVEIHRVNDFLFGHVGQVSYKPIHDETSDIGELDFSRRFEQREYINSDLCLHGRVLILILFLVPLFQQVLPFEELLPSTRADVSLSSSKIFQHTRSQRNWLLKTHPEAFFGNVNLPATISEESRAQRSGEGKSRTGSILAIGEITNLRDARSSYTTACPVVAMAAGEAGHILQLSAINTVKCTLDKSVFPVGALDSSFCGSWRSDGTPISQIKFASKLKEFNSIRWLVVQRESSTTIFEPELRNKPISGMASILGQQISTAEHIAINPIVTITRDSTGGESHCDFSINFGLDGEVPQIAIIDKSGNWSVWYLTQHNGRRGTRTKTVLKKRGSWDPSLSTRSWNTSSCIDEAYSIIWTKGLNNTDEWEHDSDLSDDLGPARLCDLRNAFLGRVGTPSIRYDSLLICNSTQLQRLPALGDDLTTWLDFSRRGSSDILLGAQIFPGSPTHTFVLTTESIYLLDVSVAEGHETSPPVILVSCRHTRNHHKKTLKMSVTQLQGSENQAASLVLLYSTHDLRAEVFWFTISRHDRTAHFYHQVIQLPVSKRPDAKGSKGIESVTAIPLPLFTSRQEKSSGLKDGAAYQVHSNKVQFYQLFVLTTDLSMSSCVISVTQGAFQKQDSPLVLTKPRWDGNKTSRFIRNKFLQQSEQAFVMPDATEENSQLDIVRPSNTVASKKCVQLRYYFIKLMEEVNRGFFREEDHGPTTNDKNGPFIPVRETLERDKVAGDCISLKPLLSFSNFWQPLDLAGIEDEWDFNLKQLKEHQETRLFNCGTHDPRLSVMDVYEKLSINWSARLPAEHLKVMQWRYMELVLQRVAAEVYLSERGIYMVPQSTLDLAAKSLPATEKDNVEDTLDELPSTQPMSQSAPSTPSATPSTRATSEAVNDSQGSQQGDEPGEEDPVVARLRMYIPSIRFTPPHKNGPSRVLSLWPTKRGENPAEYKYEPSGKGPDAEAETVKRKKEKEERRRRRAEKRTQLSIKMESAAESFSQPLPPTAIRSSPLPHDVGSSQVQSQGFVFGTQVQSQSQSQSQSFGFGGFSQTMSQPLPGEFGIRQNKLKKAKGKKALVKRGFR